MRGAGRRCNSQEITIFTTNGKNNVQEGSYRILYFHCKSTKSIDESPLTWYNTFKKQVQGAIVLWVTKQRKYLVVWRCWPMCEQVEENHILIALRSWDFSGLSCVFGIYWLQFILCGTIDISIILRYNDNAKVKEDWLWTSTTAVWSGIRHERGFRKHHPSNKR